MKPNIKNFTGNTNFKYRINYEFKNNASEGYNCNLYYEVLNHLDNTWMCFDCKTGHGLKPASALSQALESAEKAWGIKLIKEDILKTA